MNKIEGESHCGRRAARGEAAHRGKVVSEAEFRRMWNDPTLTAMQIGAILGVTPQAVFLRGKKRGLSSRKAMICATKCVLPVKEFTDMWIAGVQTRDIIAHFGCSHLTPKNTAKRLGLPLRGRGWQSGVRLADYLEQRMARRMAEGAARAQARIIAEGRADYAARARRGRSGVGSGLEGVSP